MTPLARSEWTHPSRRLPILLLTAAPVLGLALIVWFVGRLVGA